MGLLFFYLIYFQVTESGLILDFSGTLMGIGWVRIGLLIVN